MSLFHRIFRNKPSTDGGTAIAEKPRYRQINQDGLTTIVETIDGKNWFVKAKKIEEWISYKQS